MIGLAASPLRRCCRILAVAVAATPLAGCSGSAVVNALTPRSGYTVERDLSYGPNARQRLDLYVPEGAAADAPVLVFFYGGNWQSGSKELYRFVGQAFASRGYVTAIPDYRLYPEVRYPTFIEDGALAISWLQAQPATAGGRKLFVAGHSAGAYIAAMLALDQHWLAGASAQGCGRIAGDGRARRALRLPAAARPHAHGGVRPRAGEPGFAADQPCERPAVRRCCWPPAPRTAPCARATASPWQSA